MEWNEANAFRTFQGCLIQSEGKKIWYFIAVSNSFSKYLFKMRAIQMWKCVKCVPSRRSTQHLLHSPSYNEMHNEGDTHPMKYKKILIIIATPLTVASIDWETKLSALSSTVHVYVLSRLRLCQTNILLKCIMQIINANEIVLTIKVLGSVCDKY